MGIESEMLVERRQARQRLMIWRMAAVGLGMLALLVLWGKSDGKSSIHRAHIARVNIVGMILDDQKLQKLLRDLKESEEVKAVILRINSPGGTTTGGEALYLRIRELAKKKPVVSVFGTVAASAAYMAGIGADHIVTRGSTITGSIGVIVQWPDVSNLLAKLGVTVQELKSGRLKATPNPMIRTDPKNLGPMKELVADTFKWFVDLVAKRRNIKPGEVPGLMLGRVYSGRQAVRYGLADEIGGEDEAVKWLHEQKKLDADLPVILREKENTSCFNPLAAMLHALAGRLGLASHDDVWHMPPALSALAHPGLMSLWRLP